MHMSISISDLIFDLLAVIFCLSTMNFGRRPITEQGLDDPAINDRNPRYQFLITRSSRFSRSRCQSAAMLSLELFHFGSAFTNVPSQYSHWLTLSDLSPETLRETPSSTQRGGLRLSRQDLSRLCLPGSFAPTTSSSLSLPGCSRSSQWVMPPRAQQRFLLLSGTTVLSLDLTSCWV